MHLSEHEICVPSGNTTPHERALWRALKQLPLAGTHFRRQAPIGPYVVDFLCPAKRLILELDGGHHNDDETTKRDRELQAWLEQQGYRVVRFWNTEVTGDLPAVLERIYVELHGSREAEVEPLKKARKIGADEKHSAADKLMGRLAKMKSEPRKPAGKPSTHTPTNLKR